MHLQSVRSSVCSVVRKSAISLRNANDFGAGGVSVAIGELAPGLQIDLDKVPKKYAGLDGTEIAISRVPGAYGSCCCSGRRREIPWFCKRREPLQQFRLQL